MKTTTTTIAVVLGSGLTPDGKATHVTELRARAAARFVKAQSTQMRLILSGSRPPLDPSDHGQTEASVMREIALSEGVSDSDLLLEDQSFDTFGNAIFTVRRYLAKETPGTLYVVTSPFHMERALYVFKQVLGPSWTVIAHESEEWENEHRQPGAPAAMVRAQEFFADITPGDLEECERKLLAKIPAYANYLGAK